MENNNSEQRKDRGKLPFFAAGLLMVGVIVAVIVNVTKPACAETEVLKDGKCVAKVEVDTYTFEHDYPDKKNKHMKLTVEVPKSLGYQLKNNELKIELYRESDRSTISIYGMLTSQNSIVMSEKDYSTTTWADYKKTENEDGSQVVEINRIRNDKSIFGVEWSKAYSKVVEHYWSGARVTAMASGLDQGKDSTFEDKEYKTFKARETFESEDFQYMLNSIKIEISDIPEAAKD